VTGTASLVLQTQGLHSTSGRRNAGCHSEPLLYRRSDDIPVLGRVRSCPRLSPTMPHAGCTVPLRACRWRVGTWRDR
jgi:hypothetical protein